jgi:Cobalamin synthesis protein cobW C-terminal domain/DCC1-like thiol-disulfide oxidoreductase
VERWQPADSHGHTTDGHHRHADDIRTLALSLDEPVDWTRFGIWLTMLLHRHGDALLRVKGILNVADTATPVAVHGVQHLGDAALSRSEAGVEILSQLRAPWRWLALVRIIPRPVRDAVYRFVVGTVGLGGARTASSCRRVRATGS